MSQNTTIEGCVVKCEADLETGLTLVTIETIHPGLGYMELGPSGKTCRVEIVPLSCCVCGERIRGLPDRTRNGTACGLCADDERNK